MGKITKKDFTKLHKSNKLIGIASYPVTKEKMYNLIIARVSTGHELPEFPISRIDLNEFDTCYEKDNYIFVESINPTEWPAQTIAYLKIN